MGHDLAVAPLAVTGVEWSACVRGVDGDVVWQQDAGRVLPTASVGKLLLLLETARRIDAGSSSPALLLSRGRDPVGDSGLWQRLATTELPVADLAQLVGAVSDNLATNVLLRHVGLDAVDALRRALGLVGTRLLDEVRAVRGSEHASTLSTGRADELSALVHLLGASGGARPEGAERVTGWLAGNTDLSMVAAAFGLDPLAHRPADQPRVLLWNKTGTDAGVRADVGEVSRGRTAYAYAVLAAWQPGLTPNPTSEVLASMRAVGAALDTSLGWAQLG